MVLWGVWYILDLCINKCFCIHLALNFLGCNGALENLTAWDSGAPKHPMTLGAC